MRAIYIAEIEIDEELTDCTSQSRHNALMTLEMMMNTALCHTTKDGKPFVKKVGRAETVLLENTIRGYQVRVEERAFVGKGIQYPCKDHGIVLSRPPTKES
jgi:predicted nucleic acid-binding OB-fold protein